MTIRMSHICIYLLIKMQFLLSCLLFMGVVPIKASHDPPRRIYGEKGLSGVLNGFWTSLLLTKCARSKLATTVLNLHAVLQLNERIRRLDSPRPVSRRNSPSHHQFSFSIFRFPTLESIKCMCRTGPFLTDLLLPLLLTSYPVRGVAVNPDWLPTGMTLGWLLRCCWHWSELENHTR